MVMPQYLRLSDGLISAQARMFERDSADVALGINIKQGVFIKVFSLRDA